MGCENRSVVRLKCSSGHAEWNVLMIGPGDVPEEGIPSSREHLLTDAYGHLPGYCNPRKSVRVIRGAVFGLIALLAYSFGLLTTGKQTG